MNRAPRPPNPQCFIKASPEALAAQLQNGPHEQKAAALLKHNAPHLFSDLPVFVPEQQIQQIQRTIRTIEKVASLPAYQREAFSRTPPIARLDAVPHGVFYGYDFHLDQDGPKLIEINTNAGGALLNAAHLPAYRGCCATMDARMRSPVNHGAKLDDIFLDMFREEWKTLRGDAPLRTIAIVDESPTQQGLYPEFLLFKALFERAGYKAIIAGPDELVLEDGRLRAPTGDLIDLVYNRLTDFYLQAETSTPLRRAFEAEAIVLTPHPRGHALLAHKKNLVTLSDPQQWEKMGLSSETREVLRASIPRTLHLASEETVPWSERKKYFFKPATGFGSRAAYKGAKLTRKVWQNMLADGGYIAQKEVPPSEWMVAWEGERKPLKVDIRAYTYRGEIQLLAARLYRGQTTNMKTPGGGFAAVFSPPL